jgi:hypothetical protein
MPVTEMVVAVALVAGGTLLIVTLLRLITTALFHKTVRKLVEKDPAQAQALIAQLGERRTRSGDQRIAIILIAIAIAMAAGAGIAVDDPGAMRQAIAASLFPLLVGVGLWLHLHLVERRRRADGE